MRKRRKRVFEVTGAQILVTLIIAVFALTFAFELGVSIGKKRVIEAEREVAQQDNIQMRAATRASTEEALSHDSLPDQPAKPLEVEKADLGSARQNNMREQTPLHSPEVLSEAPPQVREATKASTGGDSPHALSPQQPTEQLEVEEKEPQYTVQVGTFKSRQNAENLVERLESYEYESWLRPEPYAEETLYSVFVERFGAKDEAEQFGKSIRERLSYVTQYRVREIQE